MMHKATSMLIDSKDRRDVWNAWLLHGCQYDGKYEMPLMAACDSVPENLTSFTDAKIERANESYIHFFKDDYKSERVWRTPKHYLPLIKAYGGAIAPDFSVYREMPLAQQMYNVFRSRAIGYWWTQNGIKITPNVRWGDKRTYDFCFDGLPKHSVVAIGTHGCVKHIEDRRYFNDGFLVMLDRIKPTTVIVYGSASNRIFPPIFVCDVTLQRTQRL
jgi:hypothetical protein